PGWFIQDESPIVDAVSPRFGLIDTSKDRWAILQDQIRRLNELSDGRHKLIFLCRHGEGFHNVAEAKYGTKAWDDCWSKLNDDGELVWGPDPELTTIGEDQARVANAVWKEEFHFNIPLPRRRYCSPMTRALRTYVLTFDGIELPEGTRPLVLENCREVNGVHTCDKRRSRSYIRASFPEFDIEEGLAEEDELWTPDERESEADVVNRAKNVLDAVFSDQADTDVVSITAHSGFINGFLGAIGRPSFPLKTGGILPVVVKAVEAHNA
ncbi:putative phosphoglycerate mutase pmu1, partial [Marasmius sp. AFHP31]